MLQVPGATVQRLQEAQKKEQRWRQVPCRHERAHLVLRLEEKVPRLDPVLASFPRGLGTRLAPAFELRKF